MGFISGTTQQYQGQDITTSGDNNAYDSAPNPLSAAWGFISGTPPTGNLLDVIPAGTDLGTCINVQDDTVGGQGFVWLQFNAPSSPIGNNGGVNKSFWVAANTNSLNLTPPSDAGFNVPSWLWWVLGGIFVLALIFIYFKYYHK